MTSHEARGQLALRELPNYTRPRHQFIGGAAKKLYKLEDQRTGVIAAIATEWAKHTETPKALYWKRSIPQALFDTLESYETPSAIVAAEAYLLQFGWTVTRPEPKA